MFILHGNRETRIQIFTDHETCCSNCKDFDFDIWVFRRYYHAFFIPLFPYGEKTTKIRCNNCGTFLRSDSLSKKYTTISKTPWYYYTVPLLFVALIISGVIANLSTQKEKATFIENPISGDVYRVKGEKDGSKGYSFLRVADVKGDTVTVLSNKLLYLGYVSKLNEEDFFVQNEPGYLTKAALKQMFEKDEINSVERSYGNGTGFNRVKDLEE